MTGPKHIAARLLLFAALLGASAALAQTATVTAYTGQSCAGTRHGSSLGCNANDFTTTATFTQPASSTVTSCVAGQNLTLSLVAHITGSQSTRYNAGVFFGEAGNDPSANNAAATCGLAVFPLTPAPFENYDNNSCGDFLNGSSSADLEVDGLVVKCQSSATSGGHLIVPFTVVWDANAGNATSCSATTITASSSSKCSTNTSTQVTTVGGTPVGVYGFVNLTKQVNPSGDTTTFSFTTPNSSPTPSPSSFTLQGGQTQQVLTLLGSTSSIVEIDETQVAGWSSTSTITCTSPSGGAASYVTVDTANRKLIATLDTTHYGANCTLTNEKAAKITIKEQSLGGTGSFTFSGGTNGLPSTLSLDTSVANPATSSAYSVTTDGTATAITQTVPTGDTLTASCTDGMSTFGTLSGGTLTLPAANLTANAQITCTFVDTAKASVIKAFSPTSVAPSSASTLTFTVANSSGSPAQSSLGFTDAFPAGLVIASPLTTSNTCGGSLTAVAGGTSLQLSGGSLASGASSCTVTVKVSAASNGTYTNGASNVSVTGALLDAVTSQSLLVTSTPVLKLTKTASPTSAAPGTVVTYTLKATNAGTANATSVVLSDHLSAYTQLSLNSFGSNAPFQFVDGSPTSGLTLGTPVYSNNGGSSFTYTPVSGGGGAPAGYDANVTDWKIPMSGTMPANGTCSINYKVQVR